MMNRKKDSEVKEMDLTREHALSTLKAYTKSEALLKHAFAVEGVMRFFAREAGEDENYWASWDYYTMGTMSRGRKST
jgi:predicted hydrolase (HD superfamily)